MKKTRKHSIKWENIWWFRIFFLSLQKLMKAPPFFLEWTWPSEDGFFLNHNSKPILMYKNERRFRDALMPDVVTDGTKRYEVPEKWIPSNVVRNNKILPPPPAPEPEPEPIVEPEPEPAPAPAPAPVVIEPIRRDVFFLINKTEIRDTEAQKVKEIADYMAKYPESKVVVTGYADAGTGNDKINDRLAAGRADAVVKSLVNDYGIAQDRITYDSKGSRVQPFAENDLNRVTIGIAE